MASWQNGGQKGAWQQQHNEAKVSESDTDWCWGLGHVLRLILRSNSMHSLISGMSCWPTLHTQFEFLVYPKLVPKNISPAKVPNLVYMLLNGRAVNTTLLCWRKMQRMEAQEIHEEGRKKIHGDLGDLLKSIKSSTPIHECDFQCEGEKILEEGFGSQLSICNPIEDDSRMPANSPLCLHAVGSSIQIRTWRSWIEVLAAMNARMWPRCLHSVYSILSTKLLRYSPQWTGMLHMLHLLPTPTTPRLKSHLQLWTALQFQNITNIDNTTKYQCLVEQSISGKILESIMLLSKPKGYLENPYSPSQNQGNAWLPPFGGRRCRSRSLHAQHWHQFEVPKIGAEQAPHMPIDIKCVVYKAGVEQLTRAAYCLILLVTLYFQQ